MKKRFCDVGRHTVDKLWKARTKTQPSCCRTCLYKLKSGSTSDDNPKGDRKHPDKKKRAYIKPISDKQAERLKEYRKKRDEFLKGKMCQFPGCYSSEVECHHSAGRQGDLLTDERFFVALCRKHHRFVEENPEEAKRLNLSTTRTNK